MTKGGRRRRSEENPDSDFGKALKTYVHRIEGYTQKKLADESMVAEATISRMVKGERDDLPSTRNHVLAIIKALHARKVLLTRDEANALLLTIPKISVLDERDDEDRKIIDLLAPPETEVEQGVSQSDDDSVVVDDNVAVDDDIVPYEYISFDTLDTLDEGEVVAPDIVPVIHTAPVIKPIQDGDEVAASNGVLEPPITLFPTQSAIPDPVQEPPVTPLPTSPGILDPVPEPPITPPGILDLVRPLLRGTRRRQWWYVSAGLALLVIVGIILVATHQMLTNQVSACPATTKGVILYSGINYQGQCHTFSPGDYELTPYGLDLDVSSIRDPNNAFHIALYDKDKNPFYLDKDAPYLPAEWDKRADTIHIEKHRPTSCHPGTNGIIAFIDPDYSNGCLFITSDIPDLTPLNFDSDIVSIQFIGSFYNTRQLVIYSQPNYKGECGRYWQNQSDLERCARLALSVRVLPFTPPTPIPTVSGTHYAGNVAPNATLSPGSASAVIDGSVQTEWIAGHMIGFALRWAFPVTVHRVVIWDRKQSTSDNNQINKLKFSFSDGTATGSIDMISEGPRCADVTFPAKTITSLQVIPVDASGNNGYSEIEVWATTGPQYSNNTCVNRVTLAQTVPD